jgi:hypothetical protein
LTFDSRNELDLKLERLAFAFHETQKMEPMDKPSRGHDQPAGSSGGWLYGIDARAWGLFNRFSGAQTPGEAGSWLTIF